MYQSSWKLTSCWSEPPLVLALLLHKQSKKLLFGCLQCRPPLGDMLCITFSLGLKKGKWQTSFHFFSNASFFWNLKRNTIQSLIWDHVPNLTVSLCKDLSPFLLNIKKSLYLACNYSCYSSTTFQSRDFGRDIKKRGTYFYISSLETPWRIRLPFHGAQKIFALTSWKWFSEVYSLLETIECRHDTKLRFRSITERRISFVCTLLLNADLPADRWGQQLAEQNLFFHVFLNSAW